MFTREAPVTRLVVISLLLLAALLSAGLGAIIHLSDRVRLTNELHTSAQVQADQLAASLALPVWNFDEPQLRKISESVLHDREAAGVIIEVNDLSTNGGVRTIGLLRDDHGTIQQIDTDAPTPLGNILESRPIIANGETVGAVKVFYTPSYMQAELRNHLLWQIVIFFAFGAILAASLYLLLWHNILRPLHLLEQYAREVSAGTMAELAARPKRFRGELDRLRASIEKMVTLLAARYDSLRQNQAMLSLVAQITSDLVAATPDNLHVILTRALAQIADLLNADRIVLGRTEDATGQMVARAHYRRYDPPFPDRLVISERYPALWAQLREGRISHIKSVAQLGPDQAADRTHFEEVGIQSQVTIPVLVEGRLQYLLAVATVGRLANWSDETIARVRVLAEVLATTALRCESEDAVRSSEHQFRTFIEQAPVPIILAPSPDGEKIYFNPAFTRVFGFTRQDIRSPEDWWPQIYPDPAYRARRHGAWEKLTAEVTRTGDYRDAEEAEMHTKSGETRYAQVRISLVEGYRMSFINDLTDRRQAEIALRLTQYAVDHNPVMIFRIDMEGRFIYANDAACQRFGYSPAEILRMSIWDIAQTVTRANWAARRDQLREDRSSNIETVYQTRSRTAFPVEVRVQYVNFSGVQHFFSYANDISDRKSAQEAEHAYTRRIQKLATELTRAEERQRRELATILHDGVGQNLFAATTQLLTARSRAGAAQPEVEKAISLLDQVTRDTRQLTFELCPPVLYQLGLKPALERLADQFSARFHIPCTVTGATAGPEDLNARGLAYQAIRELLNNIAKHAQAKHVNISAAESDGHVTLAISDDGIGFDSAELRPSATTSSGFGLYHLRERLELLGGDLTVVSCPGQGTRVECTLPMNIAAAPLH